MEINPKKAYEILMNGKNINPTGTWVEHSIRVGQAAERIAKKIGIDSDKAAAMGYRQNIWRTIFATYSKRI